MPKLFSVCSFDFTGILFLNSAVSSNLPNTTVLDTSVLFLQIFNDAALPTGASPTNRGRSLIVLTLLPLNSIIISPGFKPALSAGLSLLTSVTSAPIVSFRPKLSAISFVTV